MEENLTPPTKMRDLHKIKHKKIRVFNLCVEKSIFGDPEITGFDRYLMISPRPQFDPLGARRASRMVDFDMNFKAVSQAILLYKKTDNFELFIFENKSKEEFVDMISVKLMEKLHFGLKFLIFREF